MADLVAVISTAFIPLASFISLSIYLSIHPSSPFRHLDSKRRIALPIHREEPLNGTSDKTEEDPFDIVNPVVCDDGTPVEPEKFWASMWKRKVALLVALVPPLTCNILLLVFTALGDLKGEDKTIAILVPVLLIPAHLVALFMGFVYLGENDTPSHWSTTIHLSSNLFVQFIVLAIFALLPSTPLPSAPPSAPSLLFAIFTRRSLFNLTPLTPLNVSKTLLPILHIPPLLIVLFVRRGPPLYLALDAIYPPKITDAVPSNSAALDPGKTNVTQEVQATVPEWLLFSYATDVVRQGYVAESMDIWDLPILQASMRALPRHQKMRKIYGRPQGRFGKWEGFNLLWKLARANSGALIAQTSLAAATAVGYYVPHYLLKLFINYLENDPTRSRPAWGWLLAFGLFVSNALIYIVTGVIWSISTTALQAGIKLQLNTMLFTKTLVKKDIASASDDAGNVGGVAEEAAKDRKKGSDKTEKAQDGEDEGVSSKTQIMTLFTVDVDRVTEFVFHEFAIIDSPVEIVVASIFLFNLLGNSALFGLLTTIFLLPLNHLASKIVVRAQENLMKTRDQRTALMNEILQGIRMLKFMAWERSFETRIQSIRKNELSWQARNYQIEVAFNCIWALTPVLVTVVSFLHYTLVSGHRLTPSVAFTSVAVFAELRYALSALPETFIQALQGFVSCRRIEKYMSLDEVAAIEPYEGNGDIILNNATFTWPRDESAIKAGTTVNGTQSTPATPKKAFTLANMTLRFPAGELSLICGRLGSGKSLLLAGLLGEADLLAGQVDCPRSRPNAMSDIDAKSTIPENEWIVSDMVAYVPQQAWLQNASIKDNVIFSSPWDPVRYQKVLEACSLISDLEILEDGDETEIGEKGLGLSGGQKARVSLARAVYSRARLLFLDDVLSAVDAHTAHAIMENCIKGGIIQGRTVLMVSHHTTLVAPAAAYIVALENGDVQFKGSRSEFVAGGLMFELDAEETKTKSDEPNKHEENSVEEVAVKPNHKSVISLSGAANSEPASETSSIAPEGEDTLTSSDAVLIKARTPRKLIEDEKRAKGRIAWPVWRAYFIALGGRFWWIFFIASLVLAMFVPVAEKGWLEYWTGSVPSAQTHTSTYYVVGYGIITMTGVLVSNIQFAVVYYGSLHASRKLHNAMLETVLFATLRFHDTTNRGRLLNRFGKDVEGLDSSMADNCQNVLQVMSRAELPALAVVRSLAYGLDVVVTFISITYVGGLPFLVAGSAILVVYYQAGSIYGQTSRDMRRLDSVTRSPLYSLFGETVSGVAVIRSFGASTIALQHMMQLADTNLLAFVWSWTVNRWLSARFNLLSAVVVGITAVTVLVAPGVTAAMAGFALAFANTISHDLLFVVRRFVQLEQSMVALERIKEFSELQKEAAEFTDPRPSASWPDCGAISVQKLIIRYAPDLANVLHGISFEVQPCEKIGIVGATGCGKSTLALSFFRFVEATQGRIIIDGIDIAKIGLTDLRSRVTIIPQDPTILSGTLRSTLDIFDEYDDADIFAALRRVHLLKDEEAAAEEDELSRNKNVFRDLGSQVSEGDETDELISKTIREEFSDSTILTIAHRIHTIIDFDKVIVMDQGRIAEFASPAELLRDHKSMFYALCKSTGRSEFKNLKTMAAEAERNRNKG